MVCVSLVELRVVRFVRGGGSREMPHSSKPRSGFTLKAQGRESSSAPWERNEVRDNQTPKGFYTLVAVLCRGVTAAICVTPLGYCDVWRVRNPGCARGLATLGFECATPSAWGSGFFVWHWLCQCSAPIPCYLSPLSPITAFAS
jgi:hypothetical protein